MKLLKGIERQMLRISFTDPNYMKTASDQAVWIRVFIAYVIIQTGLLAAISAYVAAGVIVESKFYALLLAIFWGLLIISFDRGIFLAKSKWMAGVRLILALFIGVIVSVPLELHILRDKIDERLDERTKNLRAELTTTDKTYGNRLQKLENIRTSLSSQIAEAINEMNAEESGVSTTGTRPGTKGDKYRAWETKLETLRKKETINKNQIQKLDSAYSISRSALLARLKNKEKSIGRKLLSRLIILKELENEPGPTGEATTQMSWGLRILFVLVEIFPALLKLSLPSTDYDTFQEVVNGKNEVLKESILLEVDYELDQLNNDITQSSGPSFIDRIKNRVKANQL